MTEEQYKERRAALVNEFWFLKSKRCKLAAKARVRAIADLDYEYAGIDREHTKEIFHYEKLG